LTNSAFTATAQKPTGSYRKRKTRKQYGAEEKIRIVLDGLRGEDSIAELCHHISLGGGGSTVIQNLVLSQLALTQSGEQQSIAIIRGPA